MILIKWYVDLVEVKLIKISAILAKQLNKRQTKHKYGAIRSVCLYGHNHDSRKEATYCLKLHEMQKEGRIRNLIIEPIYDMRVNNIVICTHQPDFDYDLKQQDGTWKPVVLDVKGMKLPVWKLKHKLFCAVYPDIDYVVV